MGAPVTMVEHHDPHHAYFQMPTLLLFRCTAVDNTKGVIVLVASPSPKGLQKGMLLLRARLFLAGTLLSSFVIKIVIAVNRVERTGCSGASTAGAITSSSLRLKTLIRWTDCQQTGDKAFNGTCLEAGGTNLLLLLLLLYQYDQY